jgi:hypothetical protein
MTTQTARPNSDRGRLPKKILCAVDLSDFSAPVLAHGALLRSRGFGGARLCRMDSTWKPRDVPRLDDADTGSARSDHQRAAKANRAVHRVRYVLTTPHG